MIIAAVSVIIMLLGNGAFSFDYFMDAAEAVIKDKDRAKQVMAIAEEGNKANEVFVEELEQLSKQMDELNKDYNLTREELTAASDKVQENRRAYFDKFVALQFQARDLVTAEEWQAMRTRIE